MHARIRILLSLFSLVLPAVAQAKKPTPPAHPAAQSNLPKPIGTFGDWIAATHQEGGQTVCYALTRPQNSAPKLPGRGDVALTVSQRPNARDIVALEAGFDYAPDATVTVQVDHSSLDFYTHQRDAYARDAKAALAAFQKGSRAIVHSPGPHGQQVTDTFGLKGFGGAYEAIVKACPGKS